MTYRKKLIEVSLPLEAINEESAREKSIRHGHPSTLHLWWARRPLAACRAVLWSSLVDDPSEYMPDEESANRERERLFSILEKLVKWENINNEAVLDAAKLEIARSVARDLGCEVPVGKEAVREFLATKAPPVLDPFAGGGSIPLEAQRLGLRAYASDLNPVAVLINKALIEIPPQFAGMPPVHPPEPGQRQESLLQREWRGAQGLAEDVRYYGKWMRDEAEKRIGHLYPKAKITEEMLAEREDLRRQGLKAGDELTVIAWLWARTVKCPNPACGCQMPLVRSFALSTKKGNRAWINPVIENHQIQYKVMTGEGNVTTGTVNRHGGHCIVCGTPVSLDYIRSEGQMQRMYSQLMVKVVETQKGRIYLEGKGGECNFLNENERGDFYWAPEQELQGKCKVSVPLYGMTTFKDLFTERQLITLSLMSSLLKTAKDKIKQDLAEKKNTEDVYATAVEIYLAFAIDKMTTTNCTTCTWQTEPTRLVAAFSRQAIPMVWDYAEANPFSGAAGDYLLGIQSIIEVLEKLEPWIIGNVKKRSATDLAKDRFEPILVSTDPPYYDNIEYADLSDYFYVWLRQSLQSDFSDLFSTLLVPKSEEIVASPFRFKDKKKANEFFEIELGKVFDQIRVIQHYHYPLTVFYAFKQYETEGTISENEFAETKIASTGWETMLQALIEAGFSVTGTWPVRTELTVALKSSISALASSIVLVCHPRPEDALVLTRRDFQATLKKDLPKALHQLQKGSIAPVDLAQAAIGPGMAIFSRYKAVLESDGSPMRVRTALALINQALDEYLAEQEGEYDGDTRWALAWFEQFGHEQGPYGVAETLSKAKNTSVEGLSHAGFLEARAGKVRLLRRGELEADWDPAKDKRLTAWEAVQNLIRMHDTEGETGAGRLLDRLGAAGDAARDLAYRLYTICERKGWAQEALAYNALVVAWPKIKEQMGQQPQQGRLL